MRALRIEYLITTIVMFLSYSLSGQDPAANQLVMVQVIVTDFENNAKSGEQLFFEGMNSGNVFKGISDEKGQFDMQLLSGDTYLIKIKSIGEAQDYNKISIPGIKEGQTYSPIVITIQISPPKFFTLDNVHFDSGKPTLKRESYAELNELLEVMILKDKMVIEIAGHTDNIGDQAANLKLSQARANSVRNFLITKGIRSDRVIAKGYGEDHPVATNDTAEGRQRNRRTEVRIIEE